MKTYPKVVALASLLALSMSASAAVPLGSKLGSFKGVYSYSNGTSGRFSSNDPINSVTVTYTEYVNGRAVAKKKTIVTGYQWQCVEFGKRFFGLNNLYDIGSGNASEYYAKASAKGLAAYKDGGTTLPAVGDLICWGGGSGGLGHVAIVREVGDTYIRVIEQNRLCDSTDADHKIGMTVTKTKDKTGKLIVSKVTVDPKGVSSKSNYWTQGWLRR